MGGGDSTDGVGGVPFVHAAGFVSVDLATHRIRFSKLRPREAHWGSLAQVRAWGRLGMSGRAHVREYPACSTAGPAAAREGYRLVEAG